MNNIIAIAIDPGTHSGVSIYESRYKCIDTTYYSFSKDSLEQCYADFWHKISSILKNYRRYKNKFLAYEYTNFSSTTAATKKSGGFQALIIILAQLHGFKVVGVNTATVKKHAGHGNFGKSEMIAEAIKFYNLLPVKNPLLNAKINKDRRGDMADSVHILRWLMTEYLGETINVSATKCKNDSQ